MEHRTAHSTLKLSSSIEQLKIKNERSGRLRRILTRVQRALCALP